MEMDLTVHSGSYCMTIMFLVAVIHVPIAKGNTLPLHPDADNVCIVEEEYSVIEQVTEHYHEQYKESKWCLRVPPRCTVYKWRLATRKVPKLVNKTRSVVQCCEGYIPNGDGCKAVCAEPCRHGFCNAPNQCSCFPGFRGRLCEDICKSGTFGRNCTQQCECFNEAFCNAMSGSCLCTPGWRGKRCADPCEENYFGYECRRPCYCDGNSCHHITGECFIPTTSVSSTEGPVPSSVPSLEQPSSPSEEDTETSIEDLSMPESIKIQSTSSIQTTPVSPNSSRNSPAAVLSTTELSADPEFNDATTESSWTEDSESASFTTIDTLWNLEADASTVSSWAASAASEPPTATSSEPSATISSELSTTTSSEPSTTTSSELSATTLSELSTTTSSELSTTASEPSSATDDELRTSEIVHSESTTQYFTTSSLLDLSGYSSLSTTPESSSTSESGFTEGLSSSTKDVEVSSTAWEGREETLISTTQVNEDSFVKEITEPTPAEGYTETTTKNSNNMIGIEKKSAGPGDSNMVGLSVAIAFSVLLSIILLFATASLAMARHRKLPIPPPSDFGLYNLYAEEPITAKAVFMNPTYSCADVDIFVPKTDLQTFKAAAATGTFEAELREILESQYDHPPLPVSRSSTPYGHLYDEINEDRFDRPVFSSFGQRT